MPVNRILKIAFAVSVVIYGAVAVTVAGPPEWAKALDPGEGAMKTVLAALTVLAAADWVLGFRLARLPEPPGFFGSARPGPQWNRTRFIIAAALVESGALFGLVLSLVLKDSRFAIAFGAVTVVLLMLMPEGE
jgi:hypothetical protein